MRTLLRTFALVALGTGARAAWRRRVELLEQLDELRGKPHVDQHAPPSHVGGPDEAVDHDRQPGVPPPSNHDYEDEYDQVLAETFPASDPPGHW